MTVIVFSIVEFQVPPNKYTFSPKPLHFKYRVKNVLKMYTVFRTMCGCSKQHVPTPCIVIETQTNQLLCKDEKRTAL